MSKARHLIPILLSAAAASTLGAQVFPLSENTWSNPDFVKRFLGSYGFNTEINPSISPEERALFEKIVPLVSSQPSAAISEIRAAVKPESSAAVIYTLGNIQFQTNDLAGAEASYKEAVRKFPNFQRAYKNLGILYVQKGSFKEALPMLLKTIELGGEGADVYGLIAYSYLNAGNSVAALRAYEQALFFEPASKDWRMGKVQCLMNLGRTDDAIAMIDELVKDFPAQTELLMLQANAFVAKDDSKNAAATLEILRSTGKANPTALMLLGDIYLSFNQADLALNLYTEAMADGKLGADRMLRIAKRLAGASAWKELDGYLAAIDATGSELASGASLEILNLKAQSDLAQNRNEEAAAKLAKVVEQDPLNGRALLLLANYHWNTTDFERAEIHYERAAKVDEVAHEALVQHARMLVARRAFQKAVPLLERAQAIRPLPHIGQYMDKVVAAARSAR